MRGLIIIVFAIGFFATLAAQLASHSTAGASSTASLLPHNSERSGADRIAELRAGNSTKFSSQGGTELEIDRDSDGQFYADVRINGAIVRMMIDTGASGIALSRNDAQMAGVATDIGMNDVVGEGADGVVRGQYVKLDTIELGPLMAQGLPAIVLNSGGQSLLGQSFLSRFSSVHIEGDKMVLR